MVNCVVAGELLDASEDEDGASEDVPITLDASVLDTARLEDGLVPEEPPPPPPQPDRATTTLSQSV